MLSVPDTEMETSLVRGATGEVDMRAIAGVTQDRANKAIANLERVIANSPVLIYVVWKRLETSRVPHGLEGSSNKCKLCPLGNGISALHCVVKKTLSRCRSVLSRRASWWGSATSPGRRHPVIATARRMAMPNAAKA